VLILELPILFQELIADCRTRIRVLDRYEIERFYNWVQSQPKIETHVHLEAAVDESFYESRLSTQLRGGLLPWKRAPFQNLRSFIEAWVALSKGVRTLSDFEAMAESFVESRRVQNIRYTEAYISPADFSFIRKRFSISPEIFEFEAVISAYIRGLKNALKMYPDIDVRLIADSLWISKDDERTVIFEGLKNISLNRDYSDSQGHPLVVAVGLGGSETHESLNEHKDFFNSVRNLGYKIDIHSGEGGDPKVHRLSVETLKPDRVVHGFSGMTENFLFSKNLVMCPLSNLMIKTFQGQPEEHPVFECLKKGYPIAIGSDDPLLLGNSLALEYSFLHAVTGEGYDIFEFTQKNARERVLAPQVLRRLDKYFRC
jgi:adenosine deaminase